MQQIQSVRSSSERLKVHEVTWLHARVHPWETVNPWRAKPRSASCFLLLQQNHEQRMDPRSARFVSSAGESYAAEPNTALHQPLVLQNKITQRRYSTWNEQQKEVQHVLSHKSSAETHYVGFLSGTGCNHHLLHLWQQVSYFTLLSRPHVTKHMWNIHLQNSEITIWTTCVDFGLKLLI